MNLIFWLEVSTSHNIIIIAVVTSLLIIVSSCEAFQTSSHSSNAFSRYSHGSNTRTTTLSSSSNLFSTPSSTSTSVAVVNIDESTPRDIGSFENWATACGVQRSDGFQLTNTQDGFDVNVSVMTTQDIPAGQSVLFVPANMIFTGGKAREEFGIVTEIENDMLVGRLHDTLPQFYLFMKILKEYELGQNSPWYPWLNSLPRYFSNGSSMTHLCTDLLPPLVGWFSNKEQVRFRQFFDGLEYVNCLSQETKSNKALAKWAFAVVCTRSFPIPGMDGGDYHIAPMADMFNHGTETEVDIQFDAEGNCYAMANRDVPANSPIRISYGDPTNPSFLFSRYGFVDESSPATFCKIMITSPKQQLIDMGYDHSRMLFYKDTGDVSTEVWDVILYRLLGDENREDQQTFYNAHMQGNYELKQSMHQQYYPKTYEVLMNHIDEFLNDMEESAVLADFVDMDAHPEESEVLSEFMDLKSNPRLPLILKHNEFVKKTFETVKNRLLSY